MRTLHKTLKVTAVFFGIILFVYLVGPKVDTPNLDKSIPKLSGDLSTLERQINNREANIPNIKPDNQARILWFDSIPQKTDYSIVYLHGWSASQEEGDPIHSETAKKYGCNLYLPRLTGHGLLEAEPMLDLTANQLIASAKEAIAIGKQLGKKVILMATSTGGTLALHLAGSDPDIAALLLYSPNIEIYDSNAKLLTKPWGLQLAKWVKGSDYHEFDTDIEQKNRYWTTKYRVEALTQLQALVDNTMTPETFGQVTQPVFLGYFYKNDSIQDHVVSVSAMLDMFEKLGTPSHKKRKVAFPEVDDHVMTSHITSKDLDAVRRETYAFLEKVLGMRPASQNAIIKTKEVITR